MDYDLQSQLLVQALKEAEGQRAVRMPKATMQGRHAMLPGAGAALDAGFNRAFGNFQKPQIEGQMQGLSDQQRGEQQALLKELMTPGSRSKEQLVQGQGPLMEPPTETVSTPLSPLDESRRRLDVYGRMSNLPMARKMAERGIASEVDMPERMAMQEQAAAVAQQQQAERIAAQQQMQSDRLVDQRERDKDRFAQQADMARLAASLRPGPAGQSDLDIELKQEKLKAMRNPAAAKLSPTDMKELYDTDEMVQSSKNSVSLLNDAKKYSDDAYSGYFALPRAQAKSVAGGSKGADATIQLNNILTGQGLESLKATFGAAPTEGERKILLDMQASADKTPAQRKEIIDRAIAASERRIQFNSQKADAIRGRTYTAPGSAPTAAPAAGPTVVRTGTRNGVKVQQMSDGSIVEVK